MTEIVLGLLASLSAVAVALGLVHGLVPIPFSNGVATTAALLGVALMLRGAYRLQRRRTQDGATLRTLGLAGTFAGLTAVGALTMPAVGETLNIIAVAGFPVGLYMMGQGVLIVFVVLLFVFAACQHGVERDNRIDDAGDAP